ncbi:hypothetical protein [Vibrio harveyi]|uniref:hypothetical protein n=1 Tax=Vibrio harveyi TaxID=669 RepID=UPI003CED6427
MTEQLVERIKLLPYDGETIEELRNEQEEERDDYFESRCEKDFIRVGLEMSEKGFTDDEVISSLRCLFRSVSDYYGN